MSIAEYSQLMSTFFSDMLFSVADWLAIPQIMFTFGLVLLAAVVSIVKKILP